MRQSSPPPPPPPRQLTALINIALAVLTLAAGTAEARCTLSDVKMTKTWPSGDLGRLIPNDEAIIRFALPADCPIANPPLNVCVVVWDNGPCDQDADLDNRCDGNYVGGAGVNTQTGWGETGRARFCGAGLLAENRTSPGTAITFITMLISASRGQNQQSHLSLIMYNPGRSLVIPINPF